MTSLRSALLTTGLALVFGFAGAWLFSLSGLEEERTRAYLLANPDILPQMAEAYERQQAGAKLAEVSDEVFAPFPGAVLGNPDGSEVLVEFTDYGCGFCRRSVEDVEALIAANPDLKVVVREWPIFQGSEGAARMALAAAEQGRYPEFHRAMFAAGKTDDAAVERAALTAGLDMARAREFAAGPQAEFELMRNRALAQQLGFDGTPSWVAGERLLFGAVGRESLAEAIEAAEQS